MITKKASLSQLCSNNSRAGDGDAGHSHGIRPHLLRAGGTEIGGREAGVVSCLCLLLLLLMLHLLLLLLLILLLLLLNLLLLLLILLLLLTAGLEMKRERRFNFICLKANC